MADPVLESALSQPIFGMFIAVRLDLTNAEVGRIIRLLDGAAEIDISGETYTGIDEDFGTIDTVETISDGGNEEAPELVLSLLPNNATTAAVLADFTMQGCEVKVYVGAFDLSTGLIIGTPELKFFGQVDVPTLMLEKGVRRVELSIVSVFERLFENDDAVRASDGYHQSIWPGELGMEYMTGTDKNLYWGARAPVGQLGGSGYYGGAGFTGWGSRVANETMNR